MLKILKKILGKLSEKQSLLKQGFELVDIVSSADSSMQKAYFNTAKKINPYRLLYICTNGVAITKYC